MKTQDECSSEIGSNEFIIYIPQDYDNECFKVASRKTRQLANMKKYIEDGGDVNCSIAISENTALIEAALNTNVECMKLLIQAGADVNLTNKYENTALMWSAHFGDLECVELLISAGADVNHMNCTGSTPLVWAAQSGKLSCVKALIQAGARIENGALEWAVDQKHYDCANVLLRAGAKITVKDDYLNDIIDAQKRDWYPELTEYYPDKFVRMMEGLLVWYGKGCELPLELVFEIGAWVAKDVNNL